MPRVKEVWGDFWQLFTAIHDEGKRFDNFVGDTHKVMMPVWPELTQWRPSFCGVFSAISFNGFWAVPNGGLPKCQPIDSPHANWI
jgi:hypothetical protein